jgi:hypothetical protein
MLKLAESVTAMVTARTQPPATPSRGGTSSSTLDASPIRRNRAFRLIAQREALTPCRLARARIIFRGRTELADEYMSFGDDEEEVEARREWLKMELEAVACSRARRQADSE